MMYTQPRDSMQDLPMDLTRSIPYEGDLERGMKYLVTAKRYSKSRNTEPFFANPTENQQIGHSPRSLPPTGCVLVDFSSPFGF